MQQREALNNAYAVLEGQKSVQSFSAFTFEEALDNQIELISGSSTTTRPNKLDYVKQVEQRLLTAVEQLKQVPPETFLEHSEDTDVNTNPDQETT